MAQKFFGNCESHNFKKHDFHSDLYLETDQKKAAHSNKHTEKEIARKTLINSCCNCSYLLFFFVWFDPLKKETSTKQNLKNLKFEKFL